MSLDANRLSADIVRRINAKAGRVVVTNDQFIQELSQAVVQEIKQANVTFNSLETAISSPPGRAVTGFLTNGEIS